MACFLRESSLNKNVRGQVSEGRLCTKGKTSPEVTFLQKELYVERSTVFFQAVMLCFCRESSLNKMYVARSVKGGYVHMENKSRSHVFTKGIVRGAIDGFFQAVSLLSSGKLS